MVSDFKTKVKNNFDRSTKSYDQVASVQKQAANYLVEKLLQDLPNFSPQKILDLGAGTAFVSEALLESFPNSNYLLNDISENMLKLASNKLNHQQLELMPGDMESIDFPNQDLIISNLAFQWLEDLYGSIKFFYERTGVLAFSTLVAGSFESWKNLFIDLDFPAPGLNYPDQFEVRSFCESLDAKNCHFYIQDFCIEHQSVIAFARYLRELGADYNSQSTSNSQFNLRKIAKRHNSSILAEYKILFALIEK